MWHRMELRLLLSNNEYPTITRWLLEVIVKAL